MVLSAAIFLPVIGLAVLGLIPRAREDALKVVALVTTLATLLVGVVITF
ncbi:MAG: hypothetical protein QOD63_1430, partial [Actinomycetota bacterium]|nr:hypothetical protein [Actinomycetota bacterium]